MTFTSAAKPRLVELVKELALVHGKVTLSSGIEADYYVDLRRATLHHEAAPLIGQVMLDMLDEAGITDYVAVGGLTMGADPVATAILHQASARGRAVDAFVVRKVAKAHGMGRQVEGPDVKGKRVVVLEDTSTTGGSPLTAAAALEAAGAIIVAVATVVDRSTGAREVIEKAGYKYFSAISLSDLNLN
jgi:orotate phosphoribosyltransferase